jgi:hypothetical protein
MNKSILTTKTVNAASITEIARQRITPSIRVPVTPENRDYLRRIRNAELNAWRESGGTICRSVAK